MKSTQSYNEPNKSFEMFFFLISKTKRNGLIKKKHNYPNEKNLSFVFIKMKANQRIILFKSTIFFRLTTFIPLFDKNMFYVQNVKIRKMNVSMSENIAV